MDKRYMFLNESTLLFNKRVWHMFVICSRQINLLNCMYNVHTSPGGCWAMISEATGRRNGSRGLDFIYQTGRFPLTTLLIVPYSFQNCITFLTLMLGYIYILNAITGGIS